MSLQVACPHKTGVVHGHPPGPTPSADYAPSLRSPWRAAGVEPYGVAAITEHKTLQMLKRYTHLRAEDLVGRLG